MVLLTFVPQTFECMLFAGIAYGLFDMPIVFCFAMGYIISCISPSVMVPGLITLLQKGYGVEKGVVSSLIAAGTFDDIVCIILFGICKTVAYNEYGMSSGKSMDEAIGMLFTEFFIGLAVGIIMGLTCYFFKYLNGFRYLLELKAFYCFAMAIAFVAAGEKSGYKDTKYIASLIFGYVAYQFWGEDKPTSLLAWTWWFYQPIFFGCVGASLLFSQIRASDLGYGFVCILCGVILRLIIVFLISWTPGIYTVKERAFMACAWLPKATVQAALSGIILADATK